MGGTFDPIHTGHLACAEMARGACGLDGVLFMVAARPSLKQEQAVSDAADRLAMCRLAIAGEAAFEVSPLEADRPGITYTADTLRALRGHYPSCVELCFIIGADSLETLPEWRDAPDLAGLASFICVSRPGRFDEGGLITAARDAGFRIEHVSAPLLDISSSEIRRRTARGEAIRYLVPPRVADYIGENGLYRRA